MMSNILRRWIGGLIAPAFYVLLVIFLAAYLRRVDFSKLAHLQFNSWYLLLATILALVSRYVGMYAWIVILRTLGATNLRLHRQLMYVYAKAWMGRYIPGTAPWILGKIYFASKHGISKQKLAVSSLLEGGIQIVTLLVFSLALLVFDKRLDVLGSGFKSLMITVALAGILILLPPIFNRLFSFAYRVVRRKSVEAGHAATNRTIAYGTGLYLLSALTNGLSLFFIAKAIDPALSYGNMVFATGAASLAGAASMLAVFAPSGLGVRESIQLVLFALIMPKELALVVTVLTRFWDVGTDVLFWGLSRAMVGKVPANGEALEKVGAKPQRAAR